MVSTQSTKCSVRCTCLSAGVLLFEIGLIACFTLCVVGLAYQEFYYQHGEAFEGRLLTRVDYDFDEFTYSYKLHLNGHTYVNYTDTWSYNDAYNFVCSYQDPQPDYCHDLKHISGNNLEYFLYYYVFGSIFLPWIIDVFAGLWRCCCGGKCGIRRCCQCSRECEKGLDISFYFILLLLTGCCVLGYTLFFYVFHTNFNKAKPAFDQVMLQLVHIENVNWDKIEIGKSNYFVGSALICSFISFSLVLVFTIGLCFGCCEITELTGVNNNNNKDNQRVTLITDETPPTPYTIVVNNNQ